MTSQIQLVQQDLKRNLNIELTIAESDYTTYFGRYAQGDWEGTPWGFQTDTLGGLDLRATFGYGRSALARLWIDAVLGRRAGRRGASAAPGV